MNRMFFGGFGVSQPLLFVVDVVNERPEEMEITYHGVDVEMAPAPDAQGLVSTFRVEFPSDIEMVDLTSPVPVTPVAQPVPTIQMESVVVSPEPIDPFEIPMGPGVWGMGGSED